MKYKTLLLLSVCWLPQIQAETEREIGISSADKAELKVSYPSLQTLISTLGAKAETRPQSPPVAATIRNVSYDVELKSAQQIEVAAHFSTSVFTSSWHSLPILKQGVSIREMEPANTVIIAHEGMLCLLSEKAGEYEFSLKFLIPAEVDGGFQLDFVKSVASQIHLKNTDDYELSNALGLGDGSYLLPADGSGVRMIPKRTTAAAASSWSANVKVLYVVADAELLAQSRIQLTAQQGGHATLANIDLPKDARVVAVSGPDLSSWKQVSSDRLEIQWGTHGISRRRLNLTYSVPLPNIDETWSLEMPHLAQGQETKGQIAVYVSPELQLSAVDSTMVASLHSAPEWMKERGDPFIINLDEAGSVDLKCKRLSQIQTETAIIQNAVFRTQIVADGSTLSNGQIVVNHRSAEPITLKLPADSSILTCNIAGSLASPVLLSDGSLQLHLPSKTKSDGQVTKVNISFTSKLEEIEPIEGKLALLLPSTKHFIHELEWYITMPSAYEVTALEGNLEFSPKQTKEPHTILLTKQLSRDQAAKTDIFYRKKNL